MNCIIFLLALSLISFAYSSSKHNFKYSRAKFPTCFGKNKNNLRIAGGKLASIGDFPYQVSMQYDNQHICGGSIIKPNIILTAAHCCDEIKEIINIFSIRAGSTLTTNDGQLIGINKCIIHHHFGNGNEMELDNDIAILVLKESLDMSQIGVSIIELPNKNDFIGSGIMGTVSGWGMTENNIEATSKWLLSVKQTTLSNELCKVYYNGLVTENMLCANHFPGGTCRGDSGGPFVVNNKLVGIVSWGAALSCSIWNLPDVYTRVSSHIDWINNNIQNNY